MNKNGKCFTGPIKNLLYNDTNGNINGFVNINVFYKQNDANKGVGCRRYCACARHIKAKLSASISDIQWPAGCCGLSEWPGLGSWEWR